MTEQPRKRITIEAPGELTIHAARHLDATEGPVQPGTIVDEATRAAINQVLRFVATAHNSPDAVEYADIVFTRHRGQAITVDTTPAPTHTRIAVQVLADRYAYLHMPTPDTIVFADQVVYRITGYQDGALTLELVEDWRPTPAPEPSTDNEPAAPYPPIAVVPVKQIKAQP